MTTKVELVKGTAFELDPAKKYVIVFNKGQVTQETVQDLNSMLSEQGITAIGLIVKGDTADIKVIEQ